MKFFGRLMTVLAVVATLAAIFAVLCPTLLGYGADALFWEKWGQVYWGDHVKADVTLRYTDTNGISRTVDASSLAIFESEGSAEEKPADGKADGKTRVLTANGNVRWHFTLNNSVYPAWPDGETEIAFEGNARPKEFVDAYLLVEVVTGEKGDVTVKASLTVDGRAHDSEHGACEVSGDWGKALDLSAAE